MSGGTQDPAQTDWEGEGGAAKPQPEAKSKQKTRKRLETPVLRRKDVVDALRKLVRSVKKGAS